MVKIANKSEILEKAFSGLLLETNDVFHSEIEEIYVDFTQNKNLDNIVAFRAKINAEELSLSEKASEQLKEAYLYIDDCIATLFFICEEYLEESE